MLNKKSPIGIFDSGLGGISVLKELRSLMPNENYIYFGDSAYAPYGIKSKKEITERCKKIVEFFKKRGVQTIVIACNTATSACVQELRESYKELSIIGMEPALKLAAQGKCNQAILVMATEFTLKEEKFEELMSRYCTYNHIYKQACPKLVEIVEHGIFEDEAYIDEQLQSYLQPYLSNQLDSIVLGCTHFVFFKEKIQAIVGDKITILDGNKGTACHVQKTLNKDIDDLSHNIYKGSCEIYNSLKNEEIIKLSEKLLKT